MRKIKIGVAGFGYWGPNLARVISTHKNAQFVAIAESNNSRIDLARKLFPDVKILYCKPLSKATTPSFLAFCAKNSFPASIFFENYEK